MTVTPMHFVIFAAVLFAIGAAGVLLRRSGISILLGIELMLNAANLALVAFGRYLGNHVDGAVYAIFVMTARCRGGRGRDRHRAATSSTTRRRSASTTTPRSKARNATASSSALVIVRHAAALGGSSPAVKQQLGTKADFVGIGTMGVALALAPSTSRSTTRESSRSARTPRRGTGSRRRRHVADRRLTQRTDARAPHRRHARQLPRAPLLEGVHARRRALRGLLPLARLLHVLHAPDS